MRRIALLATAALLTGCGARHAPAAPFLPPRVDPGGPVRQTFHAAGAPGAPGAHRYEYVFPDRAIAAYDIDHGHRLVARWSVPGAHAVRGVAASPRAGRLYLSVGGNGGTRGNGAILAYDLVANRVLWKRSFPTGTDGLAVTPDGSRLFVPVGEHTSRRTWWVMSTATGRVGGSIEGGPGPHNTIVAPNGRRVYLGPRNSRYLYVASTATLRVVQRVGPLLPGVPWWMWAAEMLLLRLVAVSVMVAWV